MKVVEFNEETTVLCPICKQVILENDEESAPEPCPHTLVIATDVGIEYSSEKIDTDELEELADDSTYDEALSKIERPRATLIKMYQKAPSYFGSYFLFEE